MVTPGTGSQAPVFQSATIPCGVAIASGVGAFVGLLTAWWGPGGSSLRRGSHSIARVAVRPVWLRAIVVASLLSVAMVCVYLVLTGKDLSIEDGILPVSQDEQALCLDHVRHVGDPVAAVIAREELTAFEALDLIVKHVAEFTDAPAALRSVIDAANEAARNVIELSERSLRHGGRRGLCGLLHAGIVVRQRA